MKKALSFLMAGLMVFSLAACGSSGPKNAEELMTLVMENPADNYELSGEINMTVSMAGGGLSFEMPMDIEMTGAICGENSMAQSVVSASILGQDMEESVKAYLYDGQAYVLDSSTNTWSAGSQDTVDGVMELSGLMDKFCTPEQFADAWRQDWFAGYGVFVVLCLIGAFVISRINDTKESDDAAIEQELLEKARAHSAK